MMHFQSFRGAKTSKLHTNALARVASNSNIGASTSSQSFSTRKQIEGNRQHVGSYSDARIYNERKHSPNRVAPLKTMQRYQQPSTPIHTRDSTIPAGAAPQRITNDGQMSRSTPVRATKPTISFRDTPSRGYNPYS